MKTYAIEFLPAAKRELAKLARPEQEALAALIRALAGDPLPEGCKAVQGYKGHYRVRDGDFRVVYELQAKRVVVLVVAVGDRKSIYQVLRRRLR